MTILRSVINAVRQTLHRVADRRRRRRDQHRHERLLRLQDEYSIPDFLRAPDPQLPPRPPAPPAEVGKEPTTIVGRIVTPDLEIIIFSDGHQLKIPRSRKGRWRSSPKAGVTGGAHRAPVEPSP